MPRIERQTKLAHLRIEARKSNACMAVFAVTLGDWNVRNPELELLFALNTARRRAVEADRRSLVARGILLVLWALV
ncbi:MAG TPA: hypothetical protein VGW76_22170 [Pyrinomonadaceae bacterium]|nr:hypothetical protein [Pyrinomonadaceae bacterium]